MLSNEEYVADIGRCPYCMSCGSLRFSDEEQPYECDDEGDGSGVITKMKCTNCSVEYFDVLRVVGFRPVSEEEGPADYFNDGPCSALSLRDGSVVFFCNQECRQKKLSETTFLASSCLCDPPRGSVCANCGEPI